ncbi:unnamed protein product [Rotaria sordida]|uniref:Uncharacterized protein n=1 Tax=Rotaria sordida TaxID=392033 RepID=A0A813WIP4_9BILA|nr:unnamed protein product [Rotaria sordida]CAF0861963.1 unnamed protein product [Rotaria sordida]CAF0919872.1 unnamed protein product [Rotaria sordida]CAF0921668.1 unnamed protein product [Rotaria sordida]CAF0927917.1 unnamed protein product [Rotaria sordida]
MELENSSSLPHAHQQIRLGDIQASIHKWSKAIEYYLHGIEYFKAVQNNLNDDNLKSIIEAQIIQCEKTIHLCLLKDRSEQAIKLQQAERISKMTRAHSTSNLKSSTKSNSMRPRHNTLQLENTVMLGGQGGMDSFAAFIFPKNHNTDETSPTQTPINAKKNKKKDSHKLEELQMSYAALKTHLKEAFDDIERLKYENNQLRLHREINIIREQNESKLFTNSDEENSENELEQTL